jgi:hypothetical protein
VWGRQRATRARPSGVPVAASSAAAHQTTLAPTLGANVPVPEGKATLEVRSDHSLCSRRRAAGHVANRCWSMSRRRRSRLSTPATTSGRRQRLIIARVGTDVRCRADPGGRPLLLRPPAVQRARATHHLFAVPPTHPTPGLSCGDRCRRQPARGAAQDRLQPRKLRRRRWRSPTFLSARSPSC